MAEIQQQHRLDQERTSLDQQGIALDTANHVFSEESKRSNRGLIFAFAIALVGMAIGGSLTAFGKGGVGLVFVFAPLISLVGVFVYESKARRDERRRSAELAAVEFHARDN